MEANTKEATTEDKGKNIFELFRPEFLSMEKDDVQKERERIRALEPELNEVKFYNHLVGLLDGKENFDQEENAKKQSDDSKIKFSRNEWVKIKYDNKSIFRIAKGAVVAGLTKEHIWLSYDSRIALGIKDNNDKSLKLLTVKKCNRFESLIWAPLYSADPILKAQYRLATFLAVFSAAVSLIALAIAIMQIMNPCC